MNPYSSAGWENFFVAEAGASAALAGLIFVAVSINLSKVLEFPSLPGRAAEALMGLMSILFISTFALIPAQPARALGMEIGALGALLWGAGIWTRVRGYREEKQHPSWVITRFILGQVATLPFVLAGWTLFHGAGGGLLWCVVGTLGGFVQAAVGAWVLLVEILR